MAIDLVPEERETCFNMTGDDHTVFQVFSDDPFWIRRLEKLGAVPTLGVKSLVGLGKTARVVR